MKDTYDPYDVWTDVEEERKKRFKPPPTRPSPNDEPIPKRTRRRGVEELTSKRWLNKKNREVERNAPN